MDGVCVILGNYYHKIYVDVYFLLEKKSQRLISLYCNLVKVDFDIRTCKMLISKLNGAIAYIYQYVHSESLIMNKSSRSQFDQFYRISIISISLTMYNSLSIVKIFWAPMRFIMIWDPDCIFPISILLLTVFVVLFYRYVDHYF